MHTLTLFLASMPILALGRSHTPVNRMHAPARHVRKDNGFHLSEKHQGQNFFDGWTFFTGKDPTSGNVDYVTLQDAQSAGIAYVQEDGTTVLKIDNKSTVPEGGKRKSVRITSKKQYNSGLFIADFWKMPHGPGVWPAYWTVGPNWPNGGEMDIIEYVNEPQHNQYTLHSGNGGACTLDKQAKGLYQNAQGTVEAFLGDVLGTECKSANGANAGCAFTDTKPGSAGTDFNKAAGGVFAHLWDETQVSIWRFARNEIPQDVTSGNPDPSSWGPPMAFWSSDSCDIKNNFKDHSIVIDTTICGDWAGSAWSSAGYPGTCAQGVANSTNFDWAMWKINYISIYQAN